MSAAQNLEAKIVDLLKRAGGSLSLTYTTHQQLISEFAKELEQDLPVFVQFRHIPEKYDEQCLGAKLLTPEEVSDRIKAEYLTSGCQASDVDWAVGELMAHCGELFETPEHAWSFLMEETHENLEKPE